jgi:hypothetical protein
LRLWACGQRASVVQAQRHVCDPVPYEKRIHDQQRRILFATGRPTRAGLGKGPAQAQRGASPVAKKSILDDSEIRDRLSFTLSRSGTGCFARRWRFGQHLEAEGYIARGGQIIDATIVRCPSSATRRTRTRRSRPPQGFDGSTRQPIQQCSGRELHEDT